MENSNSIKYDKLIRDKIPEIIEATGNKAVVEVLDSDNLQKYLNIKLEEELKEYLEPVSLCINFQSGSYGLKCPNSYYNPPAKSHSKLTPNAFARPTTS